jgi:propanol-preferring alcohol dehydrogenase
MASMRAAVLHGQASIATSPLIIEEVPDPVPAPDEILVRVEACGCCRTDLHVVEGDLPPVTLPVIPGHQVVGRVEAVGSKVTDFHNGERAGIAWLRHVDGTCKFCLAGSENLCPNARFTGYSGDGGYAEYAVVEAAFAYRLPEDLPAMRVAPLLCAGIIGYRALKRSEVAPGERLGIYGFGNSAHVTIQVARHWGCSVYVATRGEKHRALARELGACWVGDSTDEPPEKLDGAILFAPAGELVPVALQALDRGGTLALAGIYMSQIPPLEYERDLFYERSVRSVTASTRRDGHELIALASEIPIVSHVESFPLEEVNVALRRLKADDINGSAVVRVSGP